MTNYVLTAGTSILSNIGSGKGCKDQVPNLEDTIESLLDNPGDNRSAAQLRKHVERTREVEEIIPEGLRRSSDPLRDLETALRQLDGAQDLQHGWSHREMSAEGSSIWAWARADRDREFRGTDLAEILRPDDTIQLLASDTDDGIAAAALVGWLLAKTVDLAFVCDSGPGEPCRIEGRGQAGRAKVLVIEELTAKNEESFRRSMGPLGRAVGSAVAGPGPHVVLLSGGYKAVPPTVITCCEYLIGAGLPVSMGISFEDTEELLHLWARHVPRNWPDALGERRPRHPLDGWAYTAGELTGYGKMLEKALPSRASKGS